MLSEWIKGKDRKIPRFKKRLLGTWWEWVEGGGKHHDLKDMERGGGLFGSFISMKTIYIKSFFRFCSNIMNYFDFCIRPVYLQYFINSQHSLNLFMYNVLYAEKKSYICNIQYSV